MIQNSNIMAIVIINDKIKVARDFLEFLKTQSWAKVEEKEKKPNITTKKAMKQAEKGIGLTETENVEDFFEKLNS